jgi:class 3 adenylate cyclase
VGERKHVSVLFADLKGSMELLADRDPEDARKLLDPILERMMEAVHHYEGTVNQVMGDGIMALFGAPVAHEDHAVRACYAALRMQEALKRDAEEVRRREGVLPQIRVGLNSGEVVVRAIGSDLRMDYTAVGQTTHLAVRMEQMAAAGSILMSADTLRLAEGFVEVKPLGPVNVKGLSEPVEVFEVVGGGPVRTRLQAAARRGLTRFVGRDDELEQLRRAQQLAAQGHGQVAAIVGEAGVGKSRLVYEFTRSHRFQGWLVIESASVSYGKATSYLPVIDCLKGYFKIQDRDGLREIREKVTGRCSPSTNPCVRRYRPFWPCWTRRSTTPSGSGSIRGSDVTARSAPSGGCGCEKRVSARLSSSSRTSTGSTTRPRHSSTASSRACQPRASCCSSTTAPSIGTRGVARPTTASCASIPCRPRAPMSCSMPSWA